MLISSSLFTAFLLPNIQERPVNTLHIIAGEKNERAQRSRLRRRKKRSLLDTTIPTMTLAGLLLLAFILILYTYVAYSQDLYLYAVEDEDEDDPAPVMDYLVPEDETLRMSNANDTQHLPPFLMASDKHRVVEFYAPWCGHCQHFKPHYIKLARQLTAIAPKLHQHIDFHAVSCVAHRQVCMNQRVNGYPHVYVYPAGSANGTIFEAWEMHPFRILATLGIEVDGFDFNFDEFAKQDPEKSVSGSTRDAFQLRVVHNKQELYSDSFLSFDFAMRNGVFTDSPTLTNVTKLALSKWLGLLRCALPPVWKIQRYINTIMKDFDTTTANETIFLKTIEPFKPSQDWSPSCTHKDGLPGYTCGLWELFHIMTVGVMEWNKQGENKWVIISAEYAANTLRDYIEHFFGCEVCQENFLSAYDACSFDRCNRLKPHADDDDNDGYPKDWEQLPLWLWETHNAVNVRLLHERAEREGRTVTPQDEIDVRWPSRQECSSCWRDDGSWDEDVMYKYLRISYWPDDSLTADYRRELYGVSVVADDDEVVPLSVTLLPLGVLAFFAIGLYSKRARLEKSGRHKKCEDVPPDDAYSSAA